jgi:hypothetical protein
VRTILNKDATTVIKLVFGQNHGHGGRNGSAATISTAWEQRQAAQPMLYIAARTDVRYGQQSITG